VSSRTLTLRLINHRKRPAVVPIASVLALAAALGLAAPAPSGAVTISPLPGTPTAMPQTQISFLGASARSLRRISVVGSSSGRHTGRLRSYTSTIGASFLPRKPFTPGERVNVTAHIRGPKRVRTLSTHFTVARPVPPPSGSFPTAPGTPADVQSFQSEPALHPPRVTIHQPAGPSSAPGYLFAGPFFGPGQWGPMIFDNAGNLAWFRPVPPGEDAADFHTLQFRGNTDLTWWQGHTFILGYGRGEFVIANSNYKTVATVRGGNGLQADEHDFIVTPRGSAYVLAYSPVQENLSGAGGPANGNAVDNLVQEIDIHTGLVMWEWHSLGHVA